MSNNQQDMEVTFNDVCVAVLRCWRGVIAACLAAAVIFGGIQGALALKNINSVSPEQVQANNEVHRQEYEQKIAVQQQTIDRLSGNLESQRKYLEESVLMHMDPQNCWTAKASYYLASQIPEDQTADPIYALLTGYQAELTSGHVIDAAAKTVGMEPRYLKELLRITADTKSASTNRLLTVAVCHPDADMAQAILDAMKEQAEKAHAIIAERISDHELTEVTHSLIMENDIANMLQRQNDEFDSLHSMESAVTQAQKAIEKIELTVEEMPPKSDAVLAAVQGVFIGAVLGVILAAVWCSCKYLLSDKICSGADLTRRTGVRLLGSIEKEERAYKKLDRWTLNRQGRPLLPRADSFRLACNDLNSYSDGMKQILVCGEVPQEKLQQLTKALQEKLPAVRFVAGSGDLLLDIPTAEALRSCDGAILLAHAGDSRYSVVRRQADKLESLHKTLLGCIVVEK